MRTVAKQNALFVNLMIDARRGQVYSSVLDNGREIVGLVIDRQHNAELGIGLCVGVGLDLRLIGAAGCHPLADSPRIRNEATTPWRPDQVP